ncbi:hypothetical protein [Hymenobacter nivis]|uniref:Integrase catalytic domain-containing protein n=1 Tax=Hymenobacter nivis TaxID=1850093 RepID=A0A2Z3GUP8_9BACT|nr:hypothetical protein [Hymenobacter nivis]AWM35176.1 hypothetical protein DDQ68_21850 [Hymenobacter nivis]
MIVHSDRDGQYVGNAYKALLRYAKAQRSPSQRAGCYDNAQAESRWSRLKTELLELRDWPVFADLADGKLALPRILTTTTTTCAVLASAI